MPNTNGNGRKLDIVLRAAAIVVPLLLGAVALYVSGQTQPIAQELDTHMGEPEIHDTHAALDRLFLSEAEFDRANDIQNDAIEEKFGLILDILQRLEDRVNELD